MDDLKQQFDGEVAAASSQDDLERIRVAYLGKKGGITTLSRTMDFNKLSAEERKDFGRRFNELKQHAEAALAAAKAALAGGGRRLVGAVDLTLPGSGRSLGALHPISLVQMELEQIFQGMSFVIGSGFHVEEERYNFDYLNIPPDHPAREMQDTFWLTNGMLLRTHTSANQVRMLQAHGAPLRAIFPGRCFRYESVDASHENTFYQVEGLMVDRGVTISHLIAVMKALLDQIFHQDVKVRLRPGYFPFVEPGFELDCQCLICHGAGCKTCKHSGWIELLPCGMVHPVVLRHGGVDPDEYSGFAFGLGLTRLAMMKYGIPEIRLMNSGDVRFLEQFPAAV
ncbi:MAG: phenylalanine--tRNA ligase subunit alpha [Pseudomonadota bacterium]